MCSLCSVQAEIQENGRCCQDSTMKDSFVSSTGADQFSEIATVSASHREIQSHTVPAHDPMDQLPDFDSKPPPSTLELPSREEQPKVQAPNERHQSYDLHSETTSVSQLVEAVEENRSPVVQKNSELVQEIKRTETSEKNTENQKRKASHRSASIVSRKLSTDSLAVSRLKTVLMFRFYGFCR